MDFASFPTQWSFVAHRERVATGGFGWIARLLLGSLGLIALSADGAPASLGEDYNQWKQALTNAATDPREITALPGFTVELLRSALTNEGSWVAMAFDPRGRLVIAREDRGLLRFTSPTNLANTPLRVESINTNLLECRGLLFAHDSLYVNANNSRGLYRLRDTDGDDSFDEVKLLRSTPGGVGHGRNQLALGPDGMIYSIHGDDVGLPPEGIAGESPFRHYGGDRLLACAWDKHLFNASASMPFGHVIRTDPEGKKWELVAGGLRNPFGIDFNPNGDLFTFDADMEWDVGLSWYHPTRVLHLVPGGDYGWRRGTGVLPEWSPDTLPSVVDVGASSPTAVKFGMRSHFPRRWREALFILDWSYGRILAVHLDRKGASYEGRLELFLKGRPLNVTGIDFGPDGAMYFVTGGRRTQSGLYRVRWTGPAEGKEKSVTPELREPAPQPTDIWQQLDSPDQWVRHRGRVELEKQPVAKWQDKALHETRVTVALTGLLALSRAAETGSTVRLEIVERIQHFLRDPLSPEHQLMALRALTVCMIRRGNTPPDVAAKLIRALEALYPASDARVNQSLCELLVYLGSTRAVDRTLALLGRAATQEEKVHYLFALSRARSGWTLSSRRDYFTWLVRARREFQGANMLPTALNYMRLDAEQSISSDERTALADILAALEKPAPPAPAAVDRSFVKAWTMADFASGIGTGSNIQRGRKLFVDVGCATCHRVGREGGVIGPDLTGVGKRFDRRALLESILEPSRVIAEVYRNVSITLKSGAIVDGRVVGEDDKALSVAINPVDPDQRRRINKNEILSQQVSDLSPMPEGLANTLQRDELLDLVGWLERGEDK